MLMDEITFLIDGVGLIGSTLQKPFNCFFNLVNGKSQNRY